ncbi:cobalamin-dependent protein [Phytoactinopolyspora mesophila]|uniref:Helix-turn-helix domain-containing protein n=1 Tax=Phytoactinopolyspora mesophila TaxID=2650750 RepID=A0A7K3LXH5_9ACTN|nr:cobalamin-dependent protein [Phytoactinopolyspora mesophila]NDL55721.1 helix-turn-helix domain-containing protein [Phytoactinopolyspora mesophila]
MANAPSSEDEQLIDLGETARRLGVHYMTAYRYVRTGRLPAAQRDGRWRVDPAELGKLRPGPAESGARRGHGRPKARRGVLRARLLAGDEPGAWRIVETLLASGAEPSAILVDVLAGALRDIGDGWEHGELTVGDEHRATAVGIRLVGRLGATSTWRGRRRGTVVLAGAPHDAHALPSAIVATVLRSSGYDVVEFGGDTPAEVVASAAAAVGPGLRAVGISVGARQRFDDVAGVADLVRQMVPGIPVLVGGPAVKSAAVASDLGADGWAADAFGVVDVLAELRQVQR